jgi:hypothetical protein
MKKFIGTKVIMAEPMTMIEAQKVLGREIKPATVEEDGYLVEYKDGYKSWSPKSVFEEAYKPFETFLDRMKVDLEGELDKFDKGDTFIHSEKFNELSLVARVLLYAQNKTQKMYCDLLENRIDTADNNNPLLKKFDFGTAIKFLEAGGAIRRSGWNGKGLFVVKQVPSHITGDIIPKMQSLPQIAKDILMERENPHIDYTNQMLIINPDGRADSWVPSVSDVFAKDWEVVVE